MLKRISRSKVCPEHEYILIFHAIPEPFLATVVSARQCYIIDYKKQEAGMKGEKVTKGGVMKMKTANRQKSSEKNMFLLK